jgi:hypothetical protein
LMTVTDDSRAVWSLFLFRCSPKPKVRRACGCGVGNWTSRCTGSLFPMSQVR